jgi:hypothetical protein
MKRLISLILLIGILVSMTGINGVCCGWRP